MTFAALPETAGMVLEPCLGSKIHTDPDSDTLSSTLLAVAKAISKRLQLGVGKWGL